MNPLRCLYLTYDGLTDPLGQSQVIPYLIGIRKKGHPITVISFEKAKYIDRITRVKEVLSDHQIIWHSIAYSPSPPVLSGVWDLWLMKRLALSLHATTPFDVIHARSYMPALVGLSMKRKINNRLKFIFDMRGFWPDERIEGGSWNLSNPLFKLIYRYFKRKEIAFLEESDAIISLTNAGERVIRAMPNLRRLPKIHVIPCCSDLSLFDPGNISPDTVSLSKRELGLENADLVLGYLGSIGSWYLLDEMLLLFKKIKAKYQRAKFLFISHDSTELIRSSAHRVGVSPCDLVIRGANRDELPKFLSCVDLGVCFIKACFSKQASSPTKLGELMAMGIPTICNSGVGDVDELINSTNSGMLLHGFSDRDFEDAVSQIPNLLKLDRNAIRQSAIEKLSLDLAIQRYADVYRSLAEDSI